MHQDKKLHIIRQLLRIRLSQMIINEKYKKGEFKIPIHLALGHEAIAVAVDSVMKSQDQLILSHRNIHYNLARVRNLKAVLNEFYIKKSGLAQGRLGSMNLANEEKNIIYSSSILGNNLSVAAGAALGQKVIKRRGVVIVVTGDGAIEEGSFYESLLFLKSNDLLCLIIIENNEWSLATKVEERRCHINLKKLAGSVDVRYELLKCNDVFYYINKLTKIRQYIKDNKTPFCVEVKLTTLGDWRLKTEKYPQGKFVNYHAGPAPTINLSQGPLIKKSNKDPIFALKRYFSERELKKATGNLLNFLKKDINEIY